MLKPQDKPPSGNSDVLRNFTIPIKKKAPEASEPNSRDFKMFDSKELSEIQLVEIKELVTGQSYNMKQAYHFAEVQIVGNARLENNFAQRKKENIQQGVSSKESFGFVLLEGDPDEVDFICRNGLAVGRNFLGEIGSHEQGVYVSKHPDLVTPAPFFEGISLKILVVKLLLGRSKEVGIGSCDIDADPSFNSHFPVMTMEKRFMTRFDLYRSAQLFAYEHDASANVVTFPRSVLPYAVVTVHGKCPKHRLYNLITRSPAVLWEGNVEFGPKTTVPGCSLTAANRGSKPAWLGRVWNASNIVPWNKCVRSMKLAALLSPSYAGRIHFTRELNVILHNNQTCFVSYFALAMNSRNKEFTTIVNAMRTEQVASLFKGPDKSETYLIPNGELSSALSLPTYNYPMFHVLSFTQKPVARVSHEKLIEERNYTRDGPTLNQRVDSSSVILYKTFAKLYSKRGQKKKMEVKKNGVTVPESAEVSSTSRKRSTENEATDLAEVSVEELEPLEKKLNFEEMTDEQRYLVRSLPKVVYSADETKKPSDARSRDPRMRRNLASNDSNEFEKSPSHDETSKESSSAPESANAARRKSPVDPASSVQNDKDKDGQAKKLYVPEMPFHPGVYVPEPPPNSYKSSASYGNDHASFLFLDKYSFATPNLYTPSYTSWMSSNNNGTEKANNNGFPDIYAYQPRDDSSIEDTPLFGVEPDRTEDEGAHEPVKIPITTFLDTPLSPEKPSLSGFLNFTQDTDMRTLTSAPRIIPDSMHHPAYLDTPPSTSTHRNSPPVTSPWINGHSVEKSTRFRRTPPTVRATLPTTEPGPVFRAPLLRAPPTKAVRPSYMPIDPRLPYAKNNPRPKGVQDTQNPRKQRPNNERFFYR